MQSSVSLQHLPYDKHLEKNVDASIAGRLAFATQKLEEIVKAAQDAPALKQNQLRSSLPNVGEFCLTVAHEKLLEVAGFIPSGCRLCPLLSPPSF